MFRILTAELHHAAQMFAIENEAFAAPWSQDALMQEISHKHAVCFVATDENEKIHGHAYMRQIINEGHINNIAVQKESRRLGIGSLLANALIAAAHSREMIGLTLEVRESNAAAIALYKKHGFKEEGIRKNYYANPTEDGIIMWNYFDIKPINYYF